MRAEALRPPGAIPLFGAVGTVVEFGCPALLGGHFDSLYAQSRKDLHDRRDCRPVTSRYTRPRSLA
eukprot:1543915-Alexandrium_andersonii.AAC.1